ncbi:hypothetical protein CYMTET_36968 [Cymbomonas tetramitiformis]|uniref:Gamma-glutamylcyclotransferase n=1 Tax=Cymbomonas tetramitiformis TaxID=36881 RepID=A0AAE0F6X6_9CHLO|nr:hypothetical protein CYMTET_36968 [Cymbomonas tetramitiformis]
MSLVPCACGLGVRHHLRPMDKRRVQSQRQVVWKTCGRQKPKYLSVKQISQVVMMGSKGEDDVWYFAYGANMSPSCLRKRGVHPLEIVAVKCPTLQLTFNHRGAFGNLIPLDDPTEDGPRGENQRARVPCAHGALLRCRTMMGARFALEVKMMIVYIEARKEVVWNKDGEGDLPLQVE